MGKWLPTLLPVTLLVLAILLPDLMFSKDQRASNIGFGPAAWPNAMLMGIAFFAVLWILRDIWVFLGPFRNPTLMAPREEGDYDFRKALVGLAMIIAYGWALPKIGFALSSATFIASWCLYGGLRNWKIVLPVTLLGTVGLMWLFMGLALMPLPRGHGVFDSFSIWVLRVTGIY